MTETGAQDQGAHTGRGGVVGALGQFVPGQALGGGDTIKEYKITLLYFLRGGGGS